MADGLRGRARIDTPPWYDRCAVSDSAGTDDSDLSAMGLKQPGRTRERGSPLKASDPAPRTPSGRFQSSSPCPRGSAGAAPAHDGRPAPRRFQVVLI